MGNSDRVHRKRGKIDQAGERGEGGQSTRSPEEWEGVKASRLSATPEGRKSEIKAARGLERGKRALKGTGRLERLNI